MNEGLEVTKLPGREATRLWGKFLEVERESFAAPWELEGFRVELPLKWELSRAIWYRQEELAAYCIASKRERAAHVHRLAVAVRFRRSRLGSFLMSAVAGIAMDFGLEDIELSVMRGSPGVLNFYRKLGFVIDRPKPDGYFLAAPCETLRAAPGSAPPTGGRTQS